MDKIDINKLNPDQLAELAQQIEAKKQQEEQAKTNEKKAYSDLKDVTVQKVFKELQQLSSNLTLAKEKLYREFDALLELKNNCFGVNEKQLSHNWSSKDGNITIVTGSNTIDVWDETKSVGLTKVNEWLDKKSNSSDIDLINIIRELLKPNKEGDLKANRVLDLQRHAETINDPDLLEAVKLLRESHRTEKTATYIKAKYKDDKGKFQWVPLSVSSV